MPASARKDVVNNEESGLYHCYSRCVRGYYLCGEDKATGKNYDHRKDWIEQRMQFLATVMAVELTAFAIMDNHFHTVLRNRPEVVEKWSDEEVARRWLKVCSGKRDLDSGVSHEPTAEQITALLQNREKLAQVRKRLSSISWYMKFLKEHIARKANADSGESGAFWASRFKCTRLLDVYAVILCTLYVDLNPIRAAMAQTPETSRHTSAFHRIRALQSGDDSAAWLAPVDENDNGCLPMTVQQYLQMLDWTGRQIRTDKRGAIPDHLSPILQRLQLQGDHWLMGVQHFGTAFANVAGDQQHMRSHAKKNERRWYRGVNHSHENRQDREMKA